jgi:hypothetical protein
VLSPPQRQLQHATRSVYYVLALLAARFTHSTLEMSVNLESLRYTMTGDDISNSCTKVLGLQQLSGRSASCNKHWHHVNGDVVKHLASACKPIGHLSFDTISCQAGLSIPGWAGPCQCHAMPFLYKSCQSHIQLLLRVPDLYSEVTCCMHNSPAFVYPLAHSTLSEVEVAIVLYRG